MSSADDTGKDYLHLSRGTLAIPNGESEDDSPQQLYDNELDKTSGIWHRREQDAASMTSQHKNVVLVIIAINF